MSCPSRIAAAEPVSVAQPKRDVIARLKHRLARITGPEKLESTGPAAAWDLGLPEISAHLPKGGLATGLHEIAPASYPDTPAALGFAASLAVRRQPRKPVLWLRGTERQGDMGELYGAGLEALGLARANLITACLRKGDHLLWALE